MLLVPSISLVQGVGDFLEISTQLGKVVNAALALLDRLVHMHCMLRQT